MQFHIRFITLTVTTYCRWQRKCAPSLETHLPSFSCLGFFFCLQFMLHLCYYTLYLVRAEHSHMPEVLTSACCSTVSKQCLKWQRSKQRMYAGLVWLPASCSSKAQSLKTWFVSHIGNAVRHRPGRFSSTCVLFISTSKSFGFFVTIVFWEIFPLTNLVYAGFFTHQSILNVFSILHYIVSVSTQFWRLPYHATKQVYFLRVCAFQWTTNGWRNTQHHLIVQQRSDTGRKKTTSNTTFLRFEFERHTDLFLVNLYYLQCCNWLDFCSFVNHRTLQKSLVSVLDGNFRDPNIPRLNVRISQMRRMRNWNRHAKMEAPVDRELQRKCSSWRKTHWFVIVESEYYSISWVLHT